MSIDSLLKSLSKMRKYASHFDWHNKQRKELGVVEALFEGMKAAGASIYHSPKYSKKDPPDCVAEDNDGEIIGIEVTELVDEQAISENQKGTRVYRDWETHKVINAIKEILKEKDTKNYIGGPYFKLILIIFTDELTISSERYSLILNSKVFPTCKQINEVYFLFSYDPGIKSYPYIHLKLEGN